MPKGVYDKRDWCFTLNCVDAVKSDHGLARQMLDTDLGDMSNALVDLVDYMVVGFEVGEETNHPHLQGFFQLKQASTMQKLKRINKRVHWEVRKGTPEEAAAYCKKEDTVVVMEHGRLQERPKPVSFQDFIDAIANNNDVYNPKYLRYHLVYGSKVNAMLEKLHPDKPVKTKPYVEWRWGPPGAGKSRAIKEMDDLYIWDNQPFQCNYNNEKIVLMDDFREHWFSYDQLLRMIDWGMTRANRKSARAVWLKATHIYITTDRPPTSMYRGQGDVRQLLRRIDKIVEFKESP